MKKKILNLFLGAFVILSFSACNKEPGTGGRAAIKGKLLSGNINSPEYEVTNEDVEPDERVYLVYGDKADGYDKDARVNHDGSFEFKNLRKGAYQVFAYGYDPEKASSNDKSVILKSVEITDSKAVSEGNDLVIYKRADKGGTSTIKGKLYATYWSPDQTQLRGEGYIGDEVVYIKFGNSVSYDERIRSANDGSFELKNLRKGKYQVWAFSKDRESPTGKTAVVMDIEITERNQVIDLGDLEIKK